MNAAEIQARLNAMPARMSAKGLRNPTSEFQLSGNCTFKGWLVHEPLKASERGYGSQEYEWFRDGSPGDILEAMDAWIIALPSIDETRRTEFLTALAGVIELGRQNGIDEDLVNPLVESMKRLSANAISDLREAA